MEMDMEPLSLRRRLLKKLSKSEFFCPPWKVGEIVFHPNSNTNLGIDIHVYLQLVDNVLVIIVKGCASSKRSSSKRRTTSLAITGTVIAKILKSVIKNEISR
ncbi:hypothetical protein AQUCO_01400642v1 [Aquilegia coerulea]|uniref:Uncharacterized protein n=1 Tax=Aquilegia coerulea TaxID=218851 RepID=A0A2G5DXG7_AQUCA|nr:hypothetical protein AQUCO_01400642v1 [Aquilegia coerulea]